MHTALLSFVALALPFHALAALPVPEAGWPTTIKYNADGCALSSAAEAFTRRPGVEGCNPTPGSLDEGDSSWHAQCTDGNQWNISTHEGTLACGGPSTVSSLNTPSACSLNDKEERERFFCYGGTLPEDQNPWGGGADHWVAKVGLYRDSSCSEDSFFMYQDLAGLCVRRAQGGGAAANSEQWVVTSPTTVSINTWTGENCQGDPANTSPASVGVCYPMGNNAWLKGISVKFSAGDDATATTTPAPAADDPTTTPTSDPTTTPTSVPSTSALLNASPLLAAASTLAVLGVSMAQ